MKLLVARCINEQKESVCPIILEWFRNDDNEVFHLIASLEIR